MVMNKTRQVKLKLDAPVTYQTVESLTGINQQTIINALDGDESAAATIADFRQKQELRASNAAAVYGNLNDGVQSLQTVVSEEAKFIKGAGSAISDMTNEWADVRLSDKKVGHEIERTVIRSDYQLKEEDRYHKQRLNLLPVEHRANMRLIDIRHTQDKENLWKSVNGEFHQLSAKNQVKHHLSTVNKYGSKALDLGGKALGFISSLFQ
jgi:hypothetical protein